MENRSLIFGEIRRGAGNCEDGVTGGMTTSGLGILGEQILVRQDDESKAQGDERGGSYPRGLTAD